MITAPTIDRLLRFFERGYLNPSGVTQRIKDAMDPLFAALSSLAPLQKNDEAKALWLQFPRGEISDYDSFEDLKEWDVVETEEEYKAKWLEDYPNEICWYELDLAEGFNRDGSLRYRGVSLGNRMIISALMEDTAEYDYSEDATVELCSVIMAAVEHAMDKLRKGVYNDEVEASLPYWFRTGVLKRSVFWKAEPETRVRAQEGVASETLTAFRSLISGGRNDEHRIGRLPNMTANDFFRACAIGYAACGYETDGSSPSELYLRYADGRDEGLTGAGFGLNEGPGIDFNDPAQWEDWYFHRKSHGGHPWEVIRGGNSTHVDLFVMHDKDSLDFLFRTGKMSEEEYKTAKEKEGYYYLVSGKHRACEAINIYVALTADGLPVLLNDGNEILARIDGTDYIGIIPRAMTPKYCENLFPDRYGPVIDFMHVYEEEMAEFGAEIEWLPEEPARLKL